LPAGYSKSSGLEWGGRRLASRASRKRAAQGGRMRSSGARVGKEGKSERRRRMVAGEGGVISLRFGTRRGARAAFGLGCPPFTSLVPPGAPARIPIARQVAQTPHQPMDQLRELATSLWTSCGNWLAAPSRGCSAMAAVSARARPPHHTSNIWPCPSDAMRSPPAAHAMLVTPSVWPAIGAGGAAPGAGVGLPDEELALHCAGRAAVQSASRGGARWRCPIRRRCRRRTS
jgi:hypothetical protein